MGNHSNVVENVKCREKSFGNRIKILLGTIVIIMSVFFIFNVLFKYIWAFVLGLFIAYLLEKPVNSIVDFLERKVHYKRKYKSFVTAFFVILISGILVTIIGIVMYYSLQEIKVLVGNYDYYMDKLMGHVGKICHNLDNWLGLSSGCCEGIFIDCTNNINRAIGTDSSGGIARKVITVSLPVAKKTLMFVMSLIICFISSVYLSGSMEKIKQQVHNNIFKKELERVICELKKLINIYFKVQLIIMLVNSALCVGTFFVLKNPYAIVVGVLIGIVDALPIVGTGTILCPWAIVSLLLGDVWKAVILLILFVATYFVREIIESKCMGEHLGIAPITMLASIFIGLLVYGILGFILGPISYVIIKALVIELEAEIDNDIEADKI